MFLQLLEQLDCTHIRNATLLQPYCLEPITHRSYISHKLCPLIQDKSVAHIYGILVVLQAVLKVILDLLAELGFEYGIYCLCPFWSTEWQVFILELENVVCLWAINSLFLVGEFSKMCCSSLLFQRLLCVQ